MKIKEPGILKGVAAGAIFSMILLNLIPPYDPIPNIICNFVIGVPLAILLGYYIAKLFKRYGIFK